MGAIRIDWDDVSFAGIVVLLITLVPMLWVAVYTLVYVSWIWIFAAVPALGITAAIVGVVFGNRKYRDLADLAHEVMMQPDYYVKHIDGSFSLADPQPTLQITKGDE